MFDNVDDGSIAKPVASRVLNASFARRLQIDLDEQGIPYPVLKPSVTYILNPPLVQEHLHLTLEHPIFQQTTFTSSLTKTFTPSTDYKIDTRLAGRYLNYEIRETAGKDFTVSGFDMDVITSEDDKCQTQLAKM